jgi:hypothetical protein
MLRAVAGAKGGMKRTGEGLKVIMGATRMDLKGRIIKCL